LPNYRISKTRRCSYWNRAVLSSFRVAIGPEDGYMFTFSRVRGHCSPSSRGCESWHIFLWTCCQMMWSVSGEVSWSYCGIERKTRLKSTISLPGEKCGVGEPPACRYGSQLLIYVSLLLRAPKVRRLSIWYRELPVRSNHACGSTLSMAQIVCS